MYKKSTSGINGTMGVLNNNLNYKNATNNKLGTNLPKGKDYEPGTNYS
jgi:hypothetical protein